MGCPGRRPSSRTGAGFEGYPRVPAYAVGMEKTHLLAQLKTGLKTVGARQTLKALQRRAARAVFVARDADPAVVQPIVELARSQSVQLIYVESMQALGRACGIEVGASTAALVEEPPSAKRQAKGG